MAMDMAQPIEGLAKKAPGSVNIIVQAVSDQITKRLSNGVSL